MVKIRLTRMGDHKSPFYRIIVADSRSPRDGRFIEVLGTYDPHLDDGLKLDVDKSKQWIKNGAQPTDTVRALLVKAGALETKKSTQKTKADKKKKAEELTMTELVKYIVTALVDNKEQVSVTEDGDVIVVKVAKEDMGKVIGKQGRIIKSVRSVVKAASVKQGRNCTVEIDE